jgi:hypothetical protein
MAHDPEQTSEELQPPTEGKPIIVVSQRIEDVHAVLRQACCEGVEYLGGTSTEEAGGTRRLVIRLQGKRDREGAPSAHIRDDEVGREEIANLTKALKDLVRHEKILYQQFVLDCSALGPDGTVGKDGIAALIGFWKELGSPRRVILLRNAPRHLLDSLRTKGFTREGEEVFMIEPPTAADQPAQGEM